jgi:valyl-tRNA synthetase
MKIEKKKGDYEKYNLLIEVIKKIRQEKSREKRSMNSKIKLTLGKKEKEMLKENLDDLKSVTSAVEIKEGKFKIEFLQS